MFSSLIGLDSHNHVSIEAYPLGLTITEGNAGLVEPELERIITQLAESVQGRVIENPRRISVGDLPAYEVGVRGTGPTGQTIEMLGVFIFDGRTQYWVGSQWSGSNGAEIRSGYSRILETFQA